MGTAEDQDTSGRGFEAFYQVHFERVAKAVYALAGSREEAFDLAQESFLRVWERWPSFASEQEAFFFALRVGVNLGKSRVRRLLRARKLAHLLGVRERGQGDDFDEVDFRSDIASIMRDLSPRQKAALVLCDVMDFTPERAAKLLGTSVSTVRVHLTRGRARLRRAMDPRTKSTPGRADAVPRPWRLG